MAVPPFIERNALLALTQLINQDENKSITLDITQAETLYEYKKLLRDEGEGFDLVLVPSLWSESFEEYLSFPFEEGIAAQFHPTL
jgi:hypothetical protein